jgi:hypothetical protein
VDGLAVGSVVGEEVGPSVTHTPQVVGKVQTFSGLVTPKYVTGLSDEHSSSPDPKPEHACVPSSDCAKSAPEQGRVGALFCAATASTNELKSHCVCDHTILTFIAFSIE